MDTVERLQYYIRYFGGKHPDIWKKIDKLHQSCHENNYWPDWFYCSSQAVRYIINDGIDLPETDSDYVETNVIAGLSAWRKTKGIFRIDETLFKSLINSPADQVPLIGVIEFSFCT